MDHNLINIRIDIDITNASFKDINGDIDKNAIIYQLNNEFSKIKENILIDNKSHKIKDMFGNTVGTVTINWQ